MKPMVWLWVAGLLMITLPLSAGEVKVLKFSGPISDADRESLARTGVRILEAAPPNGYLVEVPETTQLPQRARLSPWEMTSRMSAELVEIVAGRIRPEEPVTIRAATLRGRSAVGPMKVARRLSAHAEWVDDGSGRGTVWVRVDPDQAAQASMELA